MRRRLTSPPVGVDSGFGYNVGIWAEGGWPVDAFMDALRKECGVDMHVVDYREHGVGMGEDAQAAAFFEMKYGDDQHIFGVGLDPDIVTASLRAIVSAANRMAAKQG